MTNPTATNPIRVCGIAGGVGATVLATLIDGIEVPLHEAEVIVARNDFRCLKAFVEANLPLRHLTIVLVKEEGRALDQTDLQAVLPGATVVVVKHSAVIARADDAGLLDHVGSWLPQPFVSNVRFSVEGMRALRGETSGAGL